jgi:RNA polymerase sigma-70 factor (ECF subfamily)
MSEQKNEMSTIETAGNLLSLVSQSQPVAAPVKELSPEALLVEAVRGGDREAFGRLYDLYAPMVHGILLARVPYREVDDLVQDVFLVALRRLSTLRDSAAFGGWLAMITRNRAVDYHRSAREVEELPEDLPGKSPAEKEAEAEAARTLEVIRGLPEAYRETLVLRLVEGMTGPEIAVRTGLTAASVRVNLHRGMKMLREKLGIKESV